LHSTLRGQPAQNAGFAMTQNKKSRLCKHPYAFIAICILLIEIMLNLALPNIPAMAQNAQAVVRFDPSAMGLKPDAQGTINIVVENVQNLYGIQFRFTFDPHILEVIDADPDTDGVQIDPASCWKDGFVAVNQVDNAGGRIDFAATLLRPAQPLSGKPVVATITFAARGTGLSALDIGSVILSDRNAQAIPFLKQSGKIGVSPGGQSPESNSNTISGNPAPGRLALAGTAILAFLAALGLFIYALRRKR
jgi:hypothetical protein